MPADVCEDRFFDLDGLASYSGLSVRSIRRYMKDPDNPLPNHHVRGSGKGHGRVLFYKREFDAWALAFPPLVKPRGRGEPSTPATLEADAAAILSRIRRR